MKTTQPGTWLGLLLLLSAPPAGAQEAGQSAPPAGAQEAGQSAPPAGAQEAGQSAAEAQTPPALAPLPVQQERARPQGSSDEPAPLANTIEITATQVERPVDDSPVPVLVLRRADLQRTGSLELSSALNFAPGVTVTITENSARGGGPGVSIQGVSGKQVLVLLNGRPFVGDSDGVIDLTAIPVSVLERIEIVAGPMAVLYGGGAIGGVINLITRQAQAGEGGPHLSTDVRYGSFNTLEGTQAIAYGARSMSALLVGSYAASDGYDLETLNGVESPLPDTDGERFRRSHLFLSYDWRPNADLDIRLDTLFSSSDRLRIYLDIPSYELSGNYYFYDWRWKEQRIFTTGSFAWSRDHLALDGWVSGSLYHRDYLAKVQGGFKATHRVSDLQDLNGRLQARWTPWSNSFLMGGIEARLQRLASTTTYIDADGFATESDEIPPSELNQGEVFVLGDVVLPRLGLEAYGGIRLNYSQKFGFYPPTVLHLKWRPLPNLVSRGSAGLGYRPPNLKELNYHFDHEAYGYVIRGNQNLLPEYSLNGNFSLEWDGGENGIVRAGYFYNDIINLIDFKEIEPEDGLRVFQTANIHAAVTQGAEVIGSARLGSVNLSAAYQYLDARDKSTGLHLLYRSTHTGKVNGSWGLGDSGVELATSLRYQGPQLVSDGSEGSTQSGEGDGSSCVDAYQAQLEGASGWDRALITQVEDLCFVKAEGFFVLDARARARFVVPGRPLKLDFYVGVNNLLNVVRAPELLSTDNTDSSQALDVRPMPGRTFFMGVRGDL